MVCPCSDSGVDGVCSKKLTVVLSEWADFSTVLIIMQYQTKTLHHMVLYRRKVGYAPSSDCCTNLQSSQPHIHSHSHHICSCILHILVIVRKSSCTRYNGTRGGVEIVIQYEAQPSTVWSIKTRHECHYIPYSLISVLSL